MERNIILSQIPLEELKEIISHCLREEIQKSLAMQNSASDDLIRIDDAAKMFRVSKVTLYKWREKGILPFYRMSSRVYFKKQEILDALNASPYHKKNLNGRKG